MSLSVPSLNAAIVDQAKDLPPAPKKVPEGSEPTSDQWTSYKPIIRHLYLERSLTLPQTRAVLWHHGLCATERQYKARFHKWEFPDKKVEHDVYQAMECVSDWCDGNDVEVQFIVPKGVHTKSINRSQIKKEVLRQNSQIKKEALRQNSRRMVDCPGTSSRISLNEALDVLDEKQCQIWSDTGILLRRDSDVFSMTRLSEGASWSHSSSASSMDSAVLCATSSTPIRNEDGLPRLGPILLRNGGMTPGTRDLEDYFFVASPTSDQMTEFDYSDMTDSVEAMHLYVDSHEWVKLPDTRPAQFQGPLRPNKYPQKATACQWASSTFLQCFGVDTHKEVSIQFDHTRAMLVLQRMLYEPQQNRCILPCLNWMSCVLSFNRKWNELEGFLEASIQVVKDTLGSELLFAIPFHFALACCRDDAAGIEAWGSYLPASHQQVIAEFGTHHPNEVVHLYYRAWYAWYQGNHQHAIELLDWCIPRAQSVMGNDNLITIQCIVMLNRGYASTLQHHKAITGLEDALRRIGKPKKPLEAFRFEILTLVARSCIAIDRLERAQALLEEVVAGLVERFGLLTYADTCQMRGEAQDRVVWTAIWLLRDVMERQGQRDEASQMFEGFREQFYRELHLAEDSPTNVSHRTLQRSLPVRPLHSSGRPNSHRCAYVEA